MVNDVSFRKRSGGFSLLEVLISIGILGLVAVATATLVAEQNKQIKQMSQRIVINDIKNALISTMQDVGTCAKTLSFIGENTPSFNSELTTNKSMTLTRIRIGQGATAPILLENNMEIAPASRLFVNSIVLDELTDVGAGKWSGIWKVNLRNEFSTYLFKPIALNPQLFDVDVTTPTVAKITGCTAVSGGGGGIGQWNTVNSTDIYYTGGKVGIGTLSPSRLFQLSISDPGTPTMLAIENIDTTNSNGANISFRGTTTGAGAASFKEFSSIQSSFSVHDNATMASSLKFWTSANGAIGERMRIDTSGRIGIGTSAPSEQLEITGNFKLPVSTSTVGVVKQGPNNFLHTIGTQSLFFGINSGPLANTGSFNTSVGYSSMAALTTGNINTAVGHRALEAVTSGGYNTSVGAGALDANTTGSENTAVGANAMNNNILGRGNSYVGDSAGARTEGNDNTGIGQQAIYTLVTGANNSAIGKDSGAGLITGSNNTYLGSNVTSADNLTNATAIGYGASVTASNSLILGGTGANAVRVGIGIAAPSRTFEVRAPDVRASFMSTTATNAAAIRTVNNSGASSVFGSESSPGGVLMTGSTAFATVLGADSFAPLHLGTAGVVRMTIDTAGNVGIGTTAPTQKLEVNGTLKVVDILYSSDKNAKHNIETLPPEESLQNICKIRPVSFDWNKSGQHDQGVIAQELANVFPDFVIENPDGTYSVKYNSLIAPLISAVQALNFGLNDVDEKVKKLEGEIDTLKKENAEIKARLEKVEKILATR